MKSRHFLIVSHNNALLYGFLESIGDAVLTVDTFAATYLAVDEILRILDLELHCMLENNDVHFQKCAQKSSGFLFSTHSNNDGSKDT